MRTRIDVKYALSLDLTDAGFDFSILSEFRSRLLAHGAERRLFDLLIEQFRERGWIKGRGKQRTDSTHVLAAIRTLNRLECVGETIGNVVLRPVWWRTLAVTLYDESCCLPRRGLGYGIEQ